MPDTKTDKKAAADAATETAKKAPHFSYTDEEVTLTLEVPITLGKGEQVIDTVTIRKPYGGELRGLSLFEVMHIDNDSLIKLLPRITTPILHRVIAEQIDPADLMTLGKCVSGFLSGKKQRAALLAEIEAAAAQQ